jgi:hypothetical protein
VIQTKRDTRENHVEVGKSKQTAVHSLMLRPSHAILQDYGAEYIVQCSMLLISSLQARLLWFPLTKQKLGAGCIQLMKETHRCKGKPEAITFLVNKENWAEQPWQWDASTTQVAPRKDGLGGSPIFSSMAGSAKKPAPTLKSRTKP